MEVFSRAPIDWHRVSRAVEFYRRCGFTMVETPWRISDDIFNATSPATATPFRCNLTNRPDILVGSAEQGLLAIMATLQPGDYMSVSPCFRDNEVDALHFSDFMKVELCRVAPKYSVAAVMELAMLAAAFAESEGVHPGVEETADGMDVSLSGVEIGSYGHRTATIGGLKHSWVYGTGLAEPRFSQAAAKQRGQK